MIRDPLLISKIKTRDMEYSMNIFNSVGLKLFIVLGVRNWQEWNKDEFMLRNITVAKRRRIRLKLKL